MKECASMSELNELQTDTIIALNDLKKKITDENAMHDTEYVRKNEE
jgi:hypothetical protein